MVEQLTSEDAERFTKYAKKLGKVKGRSRGRPKLPTTISEALTYVVTPKVMIDISKVLSQLALDGDRKAIEYIFDRLEGKPRVQGLEEGKQEDPLIVILENLNKKSFISLQGEKVTLLSDGQTAVDAEFIESDS